MTQGRFYFISDEFYTKHDCDNMLMKNKEGMHDRPCFYAFPDKENVGISWCIPISSKVKKYDEIVQHKLDKQINKGIRNPVCNTIRFGEVLGQKKAFLIQNMFPITQEYITSIYIDKNTKNPVTLKPSTEKDISTNAKHILKLVFRGYKNLVFADVLKIRANLISELVLLKMENKAIQFPTKPVSSTNIKSPSPTSFSQPEKKLGIFEDLERIWQEQEAARKKEPKPPNILPAKPKL